MDKLQRLNELTAQMDASFDEVAGLESALQEAKEHKRLLQEDIIPYAMREAGQDLLKLPSGRYLSLEHELKVRVPKNAEDEAYSYLEDLGEGGMIRRSVVVEFRQDQEQDAVVALEALRHAGFHQAYVQKSHHWNTLQAWVKAQMEDGKEVPRELFGIYERDVAQVKNKV